MSSPRHYWYTPLKKLLSKWPYIWFDESKQGVLMRSAVAKAMEQTASMPDGKRRLIAINKACLDDANIHAVAVELGEPDKVVIEWIRQFIYAVAGYAGFS